MRTNFRSVLAVGVVVATFTGGATSVDIAAVRLPLDSGITSIEPSGLTPVGIAHPVVIGFGAPVRDRAATEAALHIESSPATTGRTEWLDDRTLSWQPDHFWPAHATVKLFVAGRKTEFQTGPAVVGIASISQHTFIVTVDGSSAGLPAPHHQVHAGEEGTLLATLGRPEYATPVGTYPVLAKDRSVTMDSSSVGIPVTEDDGYRMKVDYAVRISRRGLYVHSAPWAVASMGLDNVSHGCISLAPTEAEWYYNTVSVGDPVIVQE
ncbi:MAG: Ig-like domain-containing protein [Mycolicibacterium insubricum]|nr:L,D-transpeptidase family protein [Mycobacterium sp.]